MKDYLKKMIIFILIISQFSLVHANEEYVPNRYLCEEDVRQSVYNQVVQYAKSIRKSNMSSDALYLLAKHGVTGRGKTLKLGSTHSLTSTLMNSNLALEGLSSAIASYLHVLEKTEIEDLKVEGMLGYNGGTSEYYYRLYRGKKVNDGCTVYSSDYIGDTTLNSYDQDLVWMTGTTPFTISGKLTKATSKEVVYKVTIAFSDRFDFRGGNGSVSKDVLSLLGSFLFKEFNWVSTVSFDVKVANHCSHELTQYFIKDDATLEKKIRLSSSQPWKVELTTKKCEKS